MKISRIVPAFAALSAAAIAVPNASAAPRHTAASKTESFLISVAAGHNLVVAHGAFVGGGKDDASHDAYDVLHLGGGTVRVNHPASQSHFKFNVNPKTCFATITGDGKYTLNHGTGRYEDVTGHGTYRFEVEDLLSRTKSGGCNMNAQPKVEVGEIKASGPSRSS